MMRWMRRARPGAPGATEAGLRAAQPYADPGSTGPQSAPGREDLYMEGDRPLDDGEDWETPGETVTAGLTAPLDASRRPRRRSLPVRVAGIALAGAVAGGAIVYLGLPAYRVGAAGFAQITTQAVTSSQQAAGSPAVGVYQTLSPSVVLVTNQSTVNSFYGPQNQTAWGSGVIFNSNGYIVTNDHVVNGASRVTVTLKNGKSYAAQVVGGDPSTDLAVIRIHVGYALPAATFANSSDVVPGEFVAAIGNPLGPSYAQSVTTGVVGAIRPMLYGFTQAQRVTQMIQTDAPINPGNSGGALANAQGQVIGITSMKVAQTGESGVPAMGLGFAIPSNIVQQVVNDIVRYGYVKWPWLGIVIQRSNRSSAVPTNNAVAVPETLTITAVQSGGPSAGKLQPGDVIVSWNGQPVVNYYDLVGDLNADKPGQSVTVGVLRGGSVHDITVTLGAEPKAMVEQTQPVQSPAPSSGQVQPFPFPFNPFSGLPGGSGR